MTDLLPALLISVPEGVIDLGWGHPSPRLHPLAAMQQAAAHVFAHTRVAALQYGAEQGFGPLLESLAAFLSQQDAYGMPVEPETLFLTCGASQALDMACTLLTHAGDTVFVEEPTYYLVQRIFADHHLNVIGVPTDADGLCPDALDAMLTDPTLPRPTLLYTIPTFQNPSGSPPDRRGPRHVTWDRRSGRSGSPPNGAPVDGASPHHPRDDDRCRVCPRTSASGAV